MSFLLSLSAIFAVAQAVPAAPAAPNGCPAPALLSPPMIKSYTALGDSYAAGLGSVERLARCTSGQNPASSTCTPDHCRKDVGAYGYMFAATHSIQPADFSFLACSGANSSNVATNQVASPYFGDPDLVTVQVGGNDLSAFSRIIAACVFFVNTTMCQEVIATTGGKLGEIMQNVDATLLAVNGRVKPTATKVLVGYLQFFSHNYDSNCTVVDGSKQIPGELRNEVNEVVLTANQHLSEVASGRGFRFVTADDGYDGHRWCDPEPWWILSTPVKSGMDTGGESYVEVVLGHPTAEGQDAYLAALNGVLGYS